MPRPRINRGKLFRLLALNYPKKRIKKEMKIGEATYWRAKKEFDNLSDEEKETIRSMATQEEKAKEKFIDYEFVQLWVSRMKNKPVKSWKVNFNHARKIWLILQKKNPKNWTSDDYNLRAKPEILKTCESDYGYAIAIRSLRPDLQDDIPASKPQPKFDWKYIYERIMSQGKLETYLTVGSFKHQLLKRLHLTLGCREGSTGIGGILGLEWDRINWRKKTIDVFEGKTGGGFYWLDCPLDLFGDRTFEMLKEFWIQQGKPSSGRIFEGIGYDKGGKQRLNGEEYLTDIYKETAEAIGEKYGRKGLLPHFARKLHACLLIDRDVPLEMVAGDKPFGIMGVGWEDLSTLKKYYLAFRKAKIEENRKKAQQLNI